MLESLNAIKKLCKHQKLIEKVFDARMTMQYLDVFNSVEQENILSLVDEEHILQLDSNNAVWLNPDIEKALETLAGTGEQIDLGRIGEYVMNIEEELTRYTKHKRVISVTKIVKYFNNFVHLLQENTKLGQNMLKKHLRKRNK